MSDKTRALATLSVSNLRAIPDHTSELVSQVLMGTPLKVMESIEKWFKVQTPEGYLGWMDAFGLQLITDEDFENWKKSERYFYNKLSGFAFSSPEETDNQVSDLILGDLFEAEGSPGSFLKIRLPDGRVGYVRKTDCLPFCDWVGREPDPQAVVSIVKQMMGTPYLWGGASSKASDCSGFTKLAFYTQGLILARDASQQAKYGEPIDISDLQNLQLGDLLFFGVSAQKISHVGIYLGNGDFIHSSGRVYISSIIPGDPKHDPKRNFVASRRIVNSADTEGITRVRSHEWYVI